MQLTPTALKVLSARYLRRDAGGEIVETPEGMCRRVAHCVAQGEARFGGDHGVERWEEAFFEAINQLDFLPSSTTLMNAGTPPGQLAACVVLPVEDTLEEIFEALKRMALIHQSGAGTGLTLSHLRPRGDRIVSTGGVASGPVSFLRIFDCAGQQIQRGGKRRGQNLGVLHIEHPDIEEFILATAGGGEPAGSAAVRHFSQAVGMTDGFLEAVVRGGTHVLRDPRTGQVVRTVPAAELFMLLAQSAAKTGDPGLLFLDAINRQNPTPALGNIEASSPRFAVPLLAHEACAMGSLNLSHMVREDVAGPAVDWEELERAVRLAIRFLDDVLEVGRWPTSWIASMIRANRKVGLGVMGFAELLIRLRIPYGSPQSLTLADALMSAIAGEAQAASQQLARERGVFPGFAHSVYARPEIRLRNATRLAIAPTLSISRIADTSAGIEPLLALAYRREHGLDGRGLPELDPLFLRHADHAGLSAPRLAEALRQHGALTNSADLPPELRAVFRTALQVSPEDHLRIQAAFQKHVDNAVAKQIYLPQAATAREIAVIYRRAWELGCKSVSVLRQGETGMQVVTLPGGAESDS